MTMFNRTAIATSRTSSKAFTLIELLVVISIIALLLGLLLPSLGAARRKAQTLQCLAITRSIGQAARLYLDDHDQRFAPTDHGGFGSATPQWDVQLAAYLGASGVLQAWRRTAPFHYLEDHPAAVAYYRDLLRCPQRDPQPRFTYDFSYGQNAWFSLSANETGGPTYHHENSVRRPSDTVLHGEVDGQSNHIMAQFWSQRAAPPGDGLAQRHQQRFNAVYADGHAATASLLDTFNLDTRLDQWNPASP